MGDWMFPMKYYSTDVDKALADLDDEINEQNGELTNEHTNRNIDI